MQNIFQEIAVGMSGRSVHFARINHHSVGACFHGRGKRREKIFTQSNFRDKRGASVTAGGGIAVTHIVFPTSATTAAAFRCRAPAKKTMVCRPCASPQQQSDCPEASVRDSMSPPSPAAAGKECCQQHSSAREWYRCRRARGFVTGTSSLPPGWRG